jgi:hypothetical protein
MTQCVATTRAGRRCGTQAMRGATVCRLHGGKAPQVQRRAMVRASFQELLRKMPNRPWHEVYAEALHINDVIMRHARNKVEQGETLDPGELEQLIAAAGRAGLLAKGAADIGVSQQLARQHDMEVSILMRAMGRSTERLIAQLAPHLPPEVAAGLRKDVVRYVGEELNAIAEDGSEVEVGPVGQPQARPILEVSPRSSVAEVQHPPAGQTPDAPTDTPRPRSTPYQEPPASSPRPPSGNPMTQPMDRGDDESPAIRRDTFSPWR